MLSPYKAEEIVAAVRAALKKLDTFKEYDIGKISRDEAELLVENI